MTVSYTRPLRLGIARMRSILLSPFDLGNWLAIGFAAFLAGLMDGNMGGGGSVSDDDALDGVREGLEGLVSGGWEAVLASAVAVIVAALIVTAILLVLTICLWLSSRGKFMFLDTVVTGTGRVRAPWAEYRAEGNSLFRWRLGFLVATGAAGLLVLGAAALILIPRGDPFETAGSIAVFIVLLVLLLTLGLFYAFVTLLLENFVVPVMYRRRLPATAAWSVFLPLLKERLAEFVLYALFVFVLFVGVAVVVGVVGLLTCCVGFLLLAIPYVGSVLMLPVTVSYRAFSLEFLGQFGSEYWEEPRIPEGPPAPPQPPLPTGES
jgi:hypothetical protein